MKHEKRRKLNEKSERIILGQLYQKELLHETVEFWLAEEKQKTKSCASITSSLRERSHPKPSGTELFVQIDHRSRTDETLKNYDIT